ncbi:hypothetical protein AB205_0040500, partial [Aquarana catesbeiana]
GQDVSMPLQIGAYLCSIPSAYSMRMSGKPTTSGSAVSEKVRTRLEALDDLEE